ncbi:hypothetical protein FRB94_008868 [Tulasnella sp. JGI-2019a]|nr:hypothetical protein FRB94_008868 [Tulasnella sp. JGI-2019a]
MPTSNNVPPTIITEPSKDAKSMSANVRLNNTNNTNNSKPSSKRNVSYVSVSHLMNFSLPPRQAPPMSAPRRGRRALSQQVWNKEKFVNAQYRFIMKPTEDYTVHFADPDIFFRWQDILQVIIPPSISQSPLDFASDLTSCPICLTSPPVAPRVTKCGHIYCFPCILRYLQLGDNPKWNRCPICYDSVNESHLKCVRWETPPMTTDDLKFQQLPSTLKMRLMERPHISTLALPRSSTWPSDLIPPHQAPFHFLPDVSTFSKFMLATPDYLISNLIREREQLERERMLLQSGGAFHDDVGLNFVDAADQKVQNQIEKATALQTPALNAEIGKAIQMQKEWEDQAAAWVTQQQPWQRDTETSNLVEDSPIDRPEALLSLQSQGFASSSSLPKPVPAPPRAKARKNVNPPPPPSSSSYFFYQAANGAPIFLHPLDARIILGHFKSYADLPSEIEFPTTDASYGTSTINDEVRKRYKYLSYLPEGADVVFVEAGWDLEGIVGADGLKPFEGALKLRLGKRKEKDRKDEKARMRAEERERDAALQSMTTWVAPLSRPRVVERSPSPFPLPSEAATARPAPVVPQPSSTQNAGGAWGNRSFATATQAPPPRATQQAARQGNGGHERERLEGHEEDIGWELELDAAWHEFESAGKGVRGGGNGGGKKKKAKRMLVTSGGR